MILRTVGVVAAILIVSAQLSSPRTATGHNNRGVALMTQQKFDTALSEFKTAAKLDPKLVAATVNEGIALLALGRLDEAVQTLQRVLAFDPDNIRVHFNLGLLYRSQGRLDQARQQFETVQRLAPNDAHTAYFIGAIQFQLGSYSAAASSYVRSIDLDPTFASAYFGASRAYTALEQPERARIYQDRFQALTRDSSLNATAGNQYGEQGPYGLAEEADAVAAAPMNNIEVRFSNVSVREGIRTSGTTACALDLDRDGLPDLFVGDSLYHNRGNRTPRFEKVATLQTANACAAGDYDNDDYTDLLITTANGTVLYHNNKGRLVQTPIAVAATADAAAFIDLDHDGWLDFVIGSRAFRNKADGTFSEIQMPVVSGSLSSLVPTDFDNDRDIDILESTPGGTAVVLSNNRDGTFTRVDVEPELTNHSISGIVFDFNKDSWMDFFFTRADKPALLLRNSPTQRFTPVDLPLAANLIADRGAAAFDFDNDGFIDLAFLARGNEGYTLKLLRNLGSDKFEDVSARTGLDKVRFADPHEVLAFDIDNDGDTDLIVTQNGAPPVVLQNDGGNRNGSLKISLKGLKDNHSAIGTKTEIFGESLRQKVEVTGPLPVLFGTARSHPDFFRMLWPTGVVQDEIPGNLNHAEYQELDRKG